jgi:hypothetical protein
LTLKLCRVGYFYTWFNSLYLQSFSQESNFKAEVLGRTKPKTTFLFSNLNPTFCKTKLSKDEGTQGLDKTKEKGVFFRLPLKKAVRTMTAK